ncbi:MAG: VWA domain-containing protein [Actinomycetaceae bacterium]|nr:VWA domain-containing protein [Actinomycetaceae bacterium]
MVNYEMVNGWLVPAIAALAVAVAVMAWIRRGRRSADPVLLVAHTWEVRNSPRYRFRLAQLRVLMVLLACCLGLVVVAASVLAARPHIEKVNSRQMASRDIVLCLDVSGSVVDFDAEVLETFSQIVDQFEGERVGLVIFNGSSSVVFPLSDDYEMIQEEFEEATNALTDYDRYSEFTAGTELGAGSSLIGDGLASCTQSFDFSDDERSRTILFATDNELAGEPLFRLDEAADLASERDIKVHGLYIGSGYGSDSGSFSTAIESTGGTVFEADDAGAGRQIVRDIQRQDRRELAADADVSIVEEPEYWPLLALISVAGFIAIAWRLRL